MPEQHDDQHSHAYDKIDDYVRGKMSPEEAMAFEADYLENPDLLKQVELVSRLRQGLQDASDKEFGEVKHRRDSISMVARLVVFSKQVIRFLSVPQTAVGAVAACLLALPLLINRPMDVPSAPGVNTSVYVVSSGGETRSLDEAPEVIQIDRELKRLVLGFAVPPSLGAPRQYSVSISKEDGITTWQSGPLTANHESLIYIDIAADFLSAGAYRYTVARSDKPEQFQNGIYELRVQ